MMRRLGLTLMTLLIIIGLTAATVRAQADCPAIVTQALTAIGQNCNDMARNTACYGYLQVESTFTESFPAEYFSQPADRAELLTLASVRTTALDEAAGLWGVALLHVQADVPNLSPGQAVTFIVMGDATVENRVLPDEAIQPTPPVTVTMSRAAQVLAEPQVGADVVDTVGAGALLPADAQNGRGTWIRVLTGDAVGWVERAALNANPALANLAVIEPGRYTPMQSFYFTTGVTTPRCLEAPDAVTIRSPRGQFVTLNVNGADVRIGSTITFRSGADDTAIITVQEGTLELPDGQIIETGQTVIAAIDEEQTITQFTEIREADETEREIGLMIERVIAVHDGETPDDRPPERPSGEVIHVVVAGDTLFGIAQTYDASMPAILERNNISDPRQIPIGTRLIIPNAGSGFVGLPQPTPAPATPEPERLPDPTPTPADPAAQCGQFSVIAPLELLAYGVNTFAWNAAPAADSYRVIVTNVESGMDVRRVVVETSVALNIDRENLGEGRDFQWLVEALRGGETICTSRAIRLPRAEPPPEIRPAVEFTTTRICDGEFAATVSWSFASGDDIVRIFTYTIQDQVQAYSAEGESGSLQVLSPFTAFPIDKIIVQHRNNNIELPGCAIND